MQKPLDIISISVSGMCAIHCLLTPLALILFPILSGSLLASEDFHRFLLWIILPSSALAIFLGCRRHKDMTVLWLGGSGLILLVLSAYLAHNWLGESGEKLLTLLGGTIMVIGHLRNFRLCRHNQCQL